MLLFLTHILVYTVNELRMPGKKERKCNNFQRNADGYFKQYFNNLAGLHVISLDQNQFFVFC
jgi:hypothetical protein